MEATLLRKETKAAPQGGAAAVEKRLSLMAAEETALQTKGKIEEFLGKAMGVVSELPDQVKSTLTEVRSLTLKFTSDQEAASCGRKKLIWLQTATLVLLTAGIAVSSWLLWKSTAKETPTVPVVLTEEIATARSELAALEARRGTLAEQTKKEQGELETVETNLRARREELTRLAETVSAMTQASGQAQTDLAQLQQLQQTFQFRLLPGKEGAVFAMIPDGATPFQYEGKLYVQITTAASTPH